MADKDPKEVLKETLETVEVLKDSFNSLGAIIKNTISDNLFEVDAVTKSIGRNISNEISKGFGDLGKKSEKLIENQNSLFKGQIKSKDIQKQINELADRELKIQGDINNALSNNLINTTQHKDLQGELNQKITETTDELKNQLKQSQNIEKSMGNLGRLVEGLNKIPILGQFIKTEDVLTAMRKKAAETGDKFQTMLAGIKAIGTNIKDGILDPLTIISFFLKAAVTANKESVNISKNLGYGAANADRVRANFVDIESSANNLNVTTANLNEAFNQLSEATGFVTEYSGDALTTQIKLTKQLGLTGDEAAGVYKFSVLTGQSSEATYQSMLRGYVATRNSLNVGVPFKAAIAEASKVSGQLAANMGYNAENTIRGVVATRALGTSLEQAKSQGESLLDFQSSIENELKAELITGQQLNLERARAAALMGDQVTVAEELAAQGMTAAKFSGMNVIAQKSFAEALGTTSDELANQLAKREMAIASGKSLAQITAEEAEEAAERQDIQEKFNAAMLKLQSIIGNLLAGPLGSFLDLLSGALEIINYFATPLKIIGGLFLGIYGTMQAINLVGKAIAITEGLTASIVGQKVGFQAASVASKVAENTASVFGNAQAAIGLATEGSSLSFKQLSLALEGESLATKAIAYGWALKDMFVSRAKSMWEWATTGAQAGQLAKLPATIALKSAEAAITTETAVAATVAAEAASFGAATLWIVGGLAAVAGAMAMYAMKDGVVDPNKGPVMSGDFGSVQMDPNDKAMYGADGKIKVGTNLLGEGSIESVKSSPAMDISPMISAINQVTNAVTTLNNKSWDVKLDSKSVGSGLMQNSYRSA
jgi:hypothetical protein